MRLDTYFDYSTDNDYNSNGEIKCVNLWWIVSWCNKPINTKFFWTQGFHPFPRSQVAQALPQELCLCTPHPSQTARLGNYYVMYTLYNALCAKHNCQEQLIHLSLALGNMAFFKKMNILFEWIFWIL